METHDIYDKSSLTPSEGTETASPAHYANSHSPSPAHYANSQPLSPTHYANSQPPSPAHYANSQPLSPTHYANSQPPSPAHYANSQPPSPPLCQLPAPKPRPLCNSQPPSPTHYDNSQPPSPVHYVNSQPLSPTHYANSQPLSPAHSTNSQPLNPTHSWTGGPPNTSTPGKREGHRDKLMIYSHSDPRAAEDSAHYDFLMQLRQASNPGPWPEGHAHNGAAGVYRPARPPREGTRPPCWSPGKQDSPEGHEPPPASAEGLRSVLACPFCQRTYRRDAALREHVRFCQERDGSGRLDCPLCGYSSPYRAQMERHMAMHSLAHSKHATMYDPAVENRKFKCLQCGKAFKYKHHLKEHLRIHSGEKPYECANCKKRFSHSGSYSSHLSSKKCLSGGGAGGALNGQVYATYLRSSSPGSPPAGHERNSGKGSPYAFPSPRALLDRPGAGQPEQALLEGSRLAHGQEPPGLWDPASEFYRADLYRCTSLLPYLHGGDKFGRVLQEMLRRGGAHGEEGVAGVGEGGAQGEGPGVRGAELEEGGVTCRWCSQLFPNHAVLVQHERYLCRMNRDGLEALECPPQGRGKAASQAATAALPHHAHKANGFGGERSPIRRSSWPPLPQRSPLLRHPDPPGSRPLWPTQEAGSPSPAHHPASPAHHTASPASPSFLERRRGAPRGFDSPLCLDLSAHAPACSPPSRPTPPCGTPSSAGSQSEPLDLSLPKPRWASGGERRCSSATLPGDRRPAPPPPPPPPQTPGAYGGTPAFGGPMYSAFPLFNPVMPVGHHDSLSPLSFNPPAQNSLPPLPYMLESDTESFLKRVHQDRQTLLSEALSRGCLDYLPLMEDGAEGEGGPGRKRLKKTDEGLYACDICDKTFQKSSSLLRHKYEHTGKRPHECGICKKAFKHKHHLIEHSRLHSGEKPYQCDKCGKRFSHSGSYSQHMNHRYAYCGRDPADPDPAPDLDPLPLLPLSLYRPRGRELEGVAQEAGPGGARFLSTCSSDRGLREEEEEEEEEERTVRGAELGAGGALTDRSLLAQGEEPSGAEPGAGLGADLGAKLGAEREASGMAVAGEGSPQRDGVQERDDGDRDTG
ncbi:zinc finger E-box-binding homeobox 2-like isoform X2 [Anguilla rostrata]